MHSEQTSDGGFIVTDYPGTTLSKTLQYNKEGKAG
jgi:hypothetical protein